ncbi:MAG TPA: FecR domain-containing protein [Candidatus Xenobia bacterium]|jgi:hypothetical protein
MKHTQGIALLALTGLLATALPAPVVTAQVAATASVRLSATRGTAEVLANGRWQRLKAPVTAAEGTAVRTAPGAELVATFADGSTVTLGEASTLAFTRLRPSGDHGEVGVRLLGQMTASLSPQTVQSTLVNVDMPVARATMNRAFAVAHAVREQFTGTLVTCRFQTPTARAVRMAVTEGAAVITPFYNIQGKVADVDAAHGTFTVVENGTGRARRVVVGATTLLAHSSTPKPVAETPQQMVSALTAGGSVIVYGNALAAEGPAEGETVAANIIFPEGKDFISPELFVTTGGGAAISGAGPGVGVTAGQTAGVAAGTTAPAVESGIHLASTVSRAVAPGVGGGAAAGAATLPILAGAVVVGVAAVVVSNNNNHHSNPMTPSTGTLLVTVNLGQQNGNLNVNISRAHHGAVRRNVAARAITSSEPAAAIAAAPLAGSIMAGSSFRGGASLTVMRGDTPALVATLPLGRRLQFHAGATMTQSNMFNAITEVDLGVDYRLTARQAIGLGWQDARYYMVDALGNAGVVSTSSSQVRYSVKF